MKLLFSKSVLLLLQIFLQIHFLADKNLERYSFQLYRDRPLMRWDNAPHYPHIFNFPHHFHNQNDEVSSSTRTGNLLNDYDLVITEIKKLTK